MCQMQANIFSAERTFQTPDTQPIWLTNTRSPSRDVPVHDFCTLYPEVIQPRQPCAKFVIAIE